MSFGSLGSRGGRRRYESGPGLDISRRGVLSAELSRPKPGDLLPTLDDAATEENAVLLDGSTITDGAIDNPLVAARYPWMVSGDDLVLPDARGRAFRIWDHGAGVAPDAASRSARVGGQTGDYPGTYEDDQFQAHTHTVYCYGAINNATGGAWDAAYWATGTLSANGGNETRGVNIGGALWMVLDP